MSSHNLRLGSIFVSLGKPFPSMECSVLVALLTMYSVESWMQQSVRRRGEMVTQTLQTKANYMDTYMGLICIY